jgi:hypothetical protein
MFLQYPFVISEGSDERNYIYFRAEDGGSMFLQNVGTHLQVHITSQPRRPPLKTDTAI